MHEYIRSVRKCTVLLLVILICILNDWMVKGEEVPASAFEDSKLYKYCLNLADSDDNGILTELEANSIDEIQLDNNRTGDITSLKGIEYCKKLEILYITNCSMEDITLLHELQNLKEVYFDSLSNVNDYSVIGTLTMLQKLEVDNCNINDISFLQKIPQIVDISLTYNEELRDFSSLKYTTNVQKLTLDGAGENLTDLSMLSEYRVLQEISVKETSITSIESLASSVNTLQRLIADNTKLTSISLLTDFEELMRIHVTNCQITVVPDLTSLSLLSSMQLAGNPLTTATLQDLENLLPASITHLSDWQSSVLDTNQINQMNNPTEETTDDPTEDQPDDSTEPSTEEEPDSDEEEDITPPNEDSLNYKVLEDVLGSGATVRGDINDGVYFESLRIYNLASQPEAVALVQSKVKYLHTFEIYDMGLYRKQQDNGVRVKVQPNGTVEVSVPIDYGEGMYGRVWHQEEDGSFQELKTFLKDGEIHFYTDKFSIFVLVITKLFGGENVDGDEGGYTATLDGAGDFDMPTIGSSDMPEWERIEANAQKQEAANIVAEEQEMGDVDENIWMEESIPKATKKEKQKEQKEWEDKTAKREATGTDGMASGSDNQGEAKSNGVRGIAVVVIVVSLVGTVIFTRVSDILKVLRGEKG